MRKISQDKISELITHQTAPGTAVTMYIPIETADSPRHLSENQIRFKNLIHTATAELQNHGDQSGLGGELQALLDTHYDDAGFWKHQGKGLLICAAPGMVRMYCLPVDTEEYVSVDDSFHLGPVLALLSDARDYYVLALAQQHPKLFKGDMYGLIAVENLLPTSMREALGIDELNRQSENQGSASGSSMNTGWFNGRGGTRNPQDSDRLRFFHLIDKQLCDKLDRSLPLILAGIDAENAEFRGISKYPLILQGSISGNNTETRTDDLFKKADSIIMSELVLPGHQAVSEEYERTSGANPERVAHTSAGILEAAEQGRIDKLLASMSRYTTDTIQDRVESVVRITFPEASDSKTLNNIATKVWQMSGKVVSLLPSEMPKGTTPTGIPMVARLRY